MLKKVCVSVIVVSTLFASSICLADDGRIKPKEKNAKGEFIDPGRCLNVGIEQQKCRAMQDYGLQVGCVTSGEHAALLRYGYVPVCTPVMGEGLNQLVSYCPCGCFHPKTLISVRELASGREGAIEAGELVQNETDFGLMHLTEAASMTRLTQTASPILIRTKGPEEKDLVVISTASGKVLKLTEQHAVLTVGGAMKAAVDLVATDRLVRKDGAPEAILRITREKFAGDVVNFTVDANDPKEHIIFAEDLAVGDLLWQSSLQNLKGQLLVRE